MIVRLWCGRTPADKADDYLEYVKRTGVAEYRATEGNRGVRILRRDADGEAEFLLLTEWDSVEAIKRFAGSDYETPVYYPEDDQFLLELEPHVKHYELVLEAADD